jgi:hypothetical protein
MDEAKVPSNNAVPAPGASNVVKAGCAGKAVAAIAHSATTAHVRFGEMSLPRALTIRFI